jgi:diacylglycerol kinase (ATP)
MPDVDSSEDPPGPVAVLTNDTAGRGRRRRLLPAVLERLAGAGRPLRQLDAGTGATAETACHYAIADGASAVVAVGGDGTLHAALQAVAGTGVPLGVVPAGTGNDLAAGFGVPAAPLLAAEAAAAARRAGTSRPVDLARVRGPDGATRWYGGVLAAGFDAIVNDRANRMRWPRGDIRYDLAIFLELLRLRTRPYLVELDGDAHRFDAVLVAVGNTATYGGGIRICPDADPADGLLDVVVGADMGRLTLARLRPRAYRGTHVQHRLVTAYRAREVRLVAEGITAYADGEPCAPLPIIVTSVPEALRILA